MQNLLKKGWYRCLALLIVLALQGCEPRSSATIRSSAYARPVVSNPYCAGRVIFSVPGKLRVFTDTSKFYWADVHTYRESLPEYQARVRQAMKPSSAAGRRYVRSQISLPRNHGVMLVLNEEERPPIDPSAVVILGYAYENGTSFEFRKRSVQRLSELAQQRMTAILSGVRGSGSALGGTGAGGFCLPFGSIPGIPDPHWFESSEVEGSFDWKGLPLQFRLKAMRLKSTEKNAPALAEAQSFLPEIVGKSDQYEVSTTFLEDYSATLGAATGTASVIRLRSSEGTRKIVAWHHPATADEPSNLAIVLHVWAKTAQGEGVLDEVFGRGPQHRPSIFQIRLAPSAAGQQLIAQPVTEESMTVYRARFIDPHSGKPAANFAYQVFKGNDVVDEGRTNSAGHPRAQNIDYFDDLTIRALPD